jgi:hypothetical protein
VWSLCQQVKRHHAHARFAHTSYLLYDSSHNSQTIEGDLQSTWQGYSKLNKTRRNFDKTEYTVMKFIWIVTLITLLQVHAGTYEQYFAPAEEEYDMVKFDPQTFYGAPLGGYSRATRSRLASLPIRFVGDAVFWEDDTDTGSDDTKRENSGPFFTMRDGSGREFACRIYGEHELTLSSFHDSMFEEAIEIRGSEFDSTDDNADLVDKQTETLGDVSSTSMLFPDIGIDDVTISIPDLSSTDLSRDDYEYIARSEAVPKHAILYSLKELEGSCTAYVSNSLLYKYCYQNTITQSHFEISTDFMEQASYSFDDLISKGALVVGTFKNRQIVVSDYPLLWTYYDDDDDDDENVGAQHIHEPSRVVVGMDSITVVDTYENGDVCGEGRRKSAVVQMKCCSPDEVVSRLSRQADKVILENENTFSKDIDRPFSFLVSVKEEKKCHYILDVCTNVLCDDWVDSAKGTIQSVIKSQSEGIHTDGNRTQFQKEESIRHIIDTALGAKPLCLKKEEGFWTYNFCHKDSIFQVHDQIDIDIEKGAILTVEAEKFTIGYYDKNSSESYPNESEIDHVYHPDGRPILSQDGADLRSLARQKVGAPGAYYAQEYSGGDICDGAGVTEWAKKAGKSFGDDGYVMHRATTVRFFCGKRLQLARIYEDSICHYIMDITIPALCFHEYFDIPQVKKHAVKCLMIE